MTSFEAKLELSPGFDFCPLMHEDLAVINELELGRSISIIIFLGGLALIRRAETGCSCVGAAAEEF